MMHHGSREEELVLLSTGKSKCRERVIDNTWMDGCDAFYFCSSVSARKSSSNLNLLSKSGTVIWTIHRSIAVRHPGILFSGDEIGGRREEKPRSLTLILSNFSERAF